MAQLDLMPDRYAARHRQRQYRHGYNGGIADRALGLSSPRNSANEVLARLFADIAIISAACWRTGDALHHAMASASAPSV